jgi:lipid A 3-O-deacylase
MSIRKVAVPGPSLAFPFLLFLAMALCFKSAAAQNVIATADISDAGTGTSDSAPAAATAPTPFAQRPWEIGPVIQSGFGTNDRLSFHFFMAGVHVGKVLTDPHLPGILRGQFEFAGEFFPFWQSYTPAPHLQPVTESTNGVPVTYYLPFGGGTFTGITLTPIILRWDFMGRGRFKPWAQGAGGILWTNHKYPPDFYAPYGGTSVWNFTPQFGVGFNYFVKPKRSISFAANAVHISSASLGDHNPGVNASVQFEVGYNWWK